MGKNPDPEYDGPVIRTVDLTRSFGELVAVRGLNLTVGRGRLVGMVGPDGAGKTTTMRMLGGIIEPTSGDAWINGISVTEHPDLVKEQIAYMPQRFGLYPDLSVRENLIFYADLFQVPREKRAARLEKLFGFSRLGPFQARPAGALSGGMKQKLALACALIHEPRLLLLDEPTNGVDPVSRRDFWKILYDLIREGITALVTTAYLDEAERTHETAFMSGGVLITQGPPKVLRQAVPGAMFEVVAANPGRVRRRLAEITGVMDVNIFGDRLHVRVAGPEIIDAVKEILEPGPERESLKAVTPSMEDVFLSLVPKGTETG
jgi:ABC-2 type transport system ATP-binding protein